MHLPGGVQESSVAMAYNYDYSVVSLLQDAGQHRRHGSCESLEDDHVIELRLVVDALNQLPDDTYTANKWQQRLVKFFNKKHKNTTCLSHEAHTQKTHAVDKWLAGEEELTDDEMEWINEIREKWANSKDDLKGFGQFKAKLDDILDMDDYYD